MEEGNREVRKRRLSVPSSENKKKKNNLPSASSQSPSQPKKLIDQLFETWKSNDSTQSPGPLPQTEKSEIVKKLEGVHAATQLKKSSIDLKFTELNNEKAKFEAKQRIIMKSLQFSLDMYNIALENMNSVYEDIRNIVDVQKLIEPKINESSEIRHILIQTQSRELNKKKEILAALTLENLSIEIEKNELQNSEKLLAELKKENADLEMIEKDLTDYEQILTDTKSSSQDLLTEEITLNVNIQEETNLNFQNDSKNTQEEEKFITENDELQKELESFNNIEETSEKLNTRIKEIMLKKLNPDEFAHIDLTKNLQDAESKIKLNEFKLESIDRQMDLTKSLNTLDGKLNEAKASADLILLQNADVKKLDEILVETNEKLNSLQNEELSNEIKLLSNEIEELNPQQEALIKENIDILREVNNISNYNEEEEIIRNIKLEIEQEKKTHNELMNSYNKIKETNKKHFSDYPDLLDTKVSKSFEELKIKLKADVDAAERKEISLTNFQRSKLKELEQKAKKYQNLHEEVSQELNSGEKKFTDLEKQIKDAEEELETLKNQKKETQIKKEADLKKKSKLEKEMELKKLKKEEDAKKEAELKKAAELKKEAELKKAAELKKEAELKKAAELKKETELKKAAELKKEAEFKKETELKKKLELEKEAESKKIKKEAELENEAEKKKKPMIIKEEKVNLNEETLSLIRSLKEKLPDLQSKVETENSVKNLTQKTAESPKLLSPFKNSDKKSPRKSIESSTQASPFHNSAKKSSQRSTKSVSLFSPFRTSDKKSSENQLFSPSRKSVDDLESKTDKPRETLFDKIFSQFGSQNSQRASSPLQISIKKSSQKEIQRSKPFSPLHKSADDVYSFKSNPDSEHSFEKLFSQFGSQKSNKSQNIKESVEEKKENSNTQRNVDEKKETADIEILPDEKTETKESGRSSERRFFKLSRRSKSLTPKKSR